MNRITPDENKPPVPLQGVTISHPASKALAKICEADNSSQSHAIQEIILGYHAEFHAEKTPKPVRETASAKPARKAKGAAA